MIHLDDLEARYKEVRAALKNKAEQEQKLSPEEYKAWLLKTGNESTSLQIAIHEEKRR
jgi:hypothetical protein